MSNSSYKYREFVGDRTFENRFATEAEMKSILTRVDLTADEIPLNSGGPAFISDTKTAYVEPGDYHTLILGSTGSMKTRLFILPTIFNIALAGENMVVADPKGELYDMTSGFLKEKGYEVRALNLREPEHSDCWNPLGEAFRVYREEDKDKGLGLAYDFIHALFAKAIAQSKDPYWPTMGRTFAEACVMIMFAAAEDAKEVNVTGLLDFCALVQSSNEDRSSAFDTIVNSLPTSNPIKQKLTATVTMPKNTRSCIISETASALSAFAMSKALQAVACKSTMDPHVFDKEDKKVAYFLIVPDETTTLHFFVTAFVQQVYSAAISDAYKIKGGKLPRRLNFILDEFANIPPIPNMGPMITAARSRNIRFYLVVQSDSQLHEMYHEGAEIVKTNCLNWIFLASKELPLLQQVQNLVGTDVPGGQGTPLISLYELTSLKKVWGGAEALILISRARPYMTFLPDISKYEQFLGRDTLPFSVTDMSIARFDIDRFVIRASASDVRRLYEPKPTFTDSSVRRYIRPLEE